MARGARHQKRPKQSGYGYKTREIVGVHIGDRSEAGAKALWQSLPPVYRQCALCHTDFWRAYAAVLPSQRHRAGGKESGLTHRVE